LDLLLRRLRRNVTAEKRLREQIGRDLAAAFDAGLSVRQAADAAGISKSTAWDRAQPFLAAEEAAA
jgi:hypothetical protein